MWFSITVQNTFQVPVGGSVAVALIGEGQIDFGIVFGDVFVDDGVSFAIEARRNQPAENMALVGRVADA